MELFLSIYKKQVISIVTVLILVGVLSVLNMAEATMLSLITVGAVSLIAGGINISKHLTTPTAFRRCDIKYILSLGSLAVGILCIIEIARMIIK